MDDQNPFSAVEDLTGTAPPAFSQVTDPFAESPPAAPAPIPPTPVPAPAFSNNENPFAILAPAPVDSYAVCTEHFVPTRQPMAPAPAPWVSHANSDPFVAQAASSASTPVPSAVPDSNLFSAAHVLHATSAEAPVPTSVMSNATSDPFAAPVLASAPSTTPIANPFDAAHGLPEHSNEKSAAGTVCMCEIC